jgi:hypothetical protein
MTLRELRELVQNAAKIEGYDEWSTLTDKTINRQLRRYTKLMKYPEMLVLNAELELTAATTSVSLPSDLQHLDTKSIRYSQQETNGMFAYLHAYNRYSSATEGTPLQWIRVGNTINLNPYTDILETDQLVINYWKFPEILIANTDEFPIVDLEDTVLYASAVVMCAYGDPKILPLLEQQKREAYSACCAIDGRN